MKTQSPDTHIETEKVLISLLREKTPAQKFSMVRSLSQTVIQLSKRAIRRAKPGIDDRQVDLIFVELHYGKELATRYKKYLSENLEKT